jgi:3-hydroxyisobutyryl-CoA hydrolase
LVNQVEKLRELYEKWEKDRHVRMVIITVISCFHLCNFMWKAQHSLASHGLTCTSFMTEGAGRGFCAGGDVATVYHLGKSGMKNEANDFFAKEYLLNYILGTYKKIHVALLNGIVMGGGNGVSIHGKFRVATENTLFAMPETAIGLHPDVGASYFLSRLPGHLGMITFY